MKIGTENGAGRIRITLHGELDHHTAAVTMRDTENILDRYLPRDCILDMSRLSFMDSSGIALILRLHRRMQETGGRIWIENPCPQAKRVLDASGVERIVPVRQAEKERVG